MEAGRKSRPQFGSLALIKADYNAREGDSFRYSKANRM